MPFMAGFFEGLRSLSDRPFYYGERSTTICVVLGPKKTIYVLKRIRLRFFQACGLASGRTSFASSRMAMSDRLLARKTSHAADTSRCYK